MKILALIPARKGSKDVKDKNIIIYKKKPLIYHSINVANKSKYINKILVSTDSKKYQSIAIKYGAEAPFLRPKKISGDLSLDYDFIFHAINKLKKINYIPDFIVLLRPTTPDRTEMLIDKAIKTFIKKFHTIDSLRSVSYFNQPVEKFYYLNKNLFLKGYFDKKFKGEYHNLPRQKFRKSLLPNGYIDIVKTDYIINNKKIIYGKKILPFITDSTRDIDSIGDLK